MLTFSINFGDNFGYSTQVWNAILTNLRYFKKFNGTEWAEAVQQAYMFAIEHKDERYEDMTPYIKKLARTILKKKEREKPYDMLTEDGEVALVFTKLTESMKDDVFYDKKEILDTFKELYLYNPVEFTKLKSLFQYDDEKELLSVKALRIKEEQLKREIFNLTAKHGASNVFYLLFDFLKSLSVYTRPSNVVETKSIQAKEGNYLVLSKLPEVPCVKTSDGKYHGIDKNSLTMDIDPDYVVWDIAFSTNCDIMKVDLSPLLNYMYEQIYVEQGVNTNHITWCDNKYRLVTPGGTVYIGEDREKFIDGVRIEAILNLMTNNVNTVIAVSPESVYIKPTRTFYYNDIKYYLSTGKCIELPVSVFLHKRHLVAS